MVWFGRVLLIDISLLYVVTDVPQIEFTVYPSDLNLHQYSSIDREGLDVERGSYLFSVARQPKWGLDRLAFEVYRRHTHTHTHAD